MTSIFLEPQSGGMKTSAWWRPASPCPPLKPDPQPKLSGSGGALEEAARSCESVGSPVTTCALVPDQQPCVDEGFFF